MHRSTILRWWHRIAGRPAVEISPPAVPATPMTVLITNVQLNARTGTETAVRDLALALAQAGHRPHVYTPAPGTVSDEIRHHGIPVHGRLADVPVVPDVIHGHHHVQTVEALQAFPDTPGLFVCHDRTAWHDTPPPHPRIGLYVAVDANCRERLVTVHGIDARRVRVIRNSVDLARFRPRAALPPTPRRALIFSNYATRGTHIAAVKEACRRCGLELDIVGAGVNRQCIDPESILGDYDLVFAKARAALEAMAVGCAVVLCDAGGVGEMVTPERFEWLRQWNFGMRVLTNALDPDIIAAEIARYDPAETAAVSERVRTGSGLQDAVAAYVGAYDELVAWGGGRETRPPQAEFAEYLAALVRRSGAFELGASPLPRDAAGRLVPVRPNGDEAAGPRPG